MDDLHKSINHSSWRKAGALVALFAIVFALGVLFGFKENSAPTGKDESPPVSPSASVSSPTSLGSDQQRSSVSSTTRMANPRNRAPMDKGRQAGLNRLSLIQKIRGNLSLEDLNDLFEDIFSDNYSWVAHGDMREMIMEKWAELAPLQGLAKLRELYPEESEFLRNASLVLPSFFSKWASKDPEAALSYYEGYFMDATHEGTTISHTLNGILSQYASYSPQKAWDWIEAHQGSLSPEVYETARSSFLIAIAEKHPEKIPAYIKDIHVKDINAPSQAGLAYNLGIELGKSTSPTGEILKEFPDVLQTQIQAGMLMGQTQGNWESVKSALASMSKDEQSLLVPLLAPDVLSKGALDMQERIEWVIDSLPRPQLEGECLSLVKDWMSDNPEKAQQWIISLPEGDKKETLRQALSL